MDTAVNDTTAADAIEKASADEAAKKAAEPAFVPGSEEATLAALEAEQAAIDKAAVAGIEAGTGTGSTSNATAGTETGKPATTPEAAKPAAPGADKDRAIIALRKELRNTQLKLAETTGAARVLEHMVNTGVATPADNREQQQVETPQTKIAAIDDQIVALAQDLEDGKMDQPTFERQRLGLMDQRGDIQRAMYTPQPAPQAPADTTVQDHLQTLVTQHPYIKDMTVAQLEPYQEKALQQLQLEGKLGTGNRADMAMRERMAELVRQDMLKNLGIAEDPRKSSKGAPATGTVHALSDAAKARDAKLAMAGTHPPDISTLGSGATGVPMTSEAALATLNSFGGDEDAAIRWIKANPGVEALI